MDWNKKAEELKTKLGFKFDTRLAETLGISKSAFYMFKSGREDWPVAVKIRILDKLAYVMAISALTTVLPESVANRIWGSTKRQAGRIADKNIQNEEVVKKFIEDYIDSLLVCFYRLRAADMPFNEILSKLQEANLRIDIDK